MNQGSGKNGFADQKGSKSPFLARGKGMRDDIGHEIGQDGPHFWGAGD
jgi:hypothetical protein